MRFRADRCGLNRILSRQQHQTSSISPSVDHEVPVRSVEAIDRTEKFSHSMTIRPPSTLKIQQSQPRYRTLVPTASPTALITPDLTIFPPSSLILLPAIVTRVESREAFPPRKPDLVAFPTRPPRTIVTDRHHLLLILLPSSFSLFCKRHCFCRWLTRVLMLNPERVKARKQYDGKKGREFTFQI
jgi:hypothetical protein